MKNIKFIKKFKGWLGPEKITIVFLGIFCAILFFGYIIAVKANSPDSPGGTGAGTNLQVCTNPPSATFDASNNAFINYQTSGNNIIHYWVKIFSDAGMTNLLSDSGPNGNLAYIYTQQSTSDTRPTPRCACDTDSNAVNCGGSFSASAGDPAICYDWYVRSWSETVQSGQTCVDTYIFDGNPYGYCSWESGTSPNCSFISEGWGCHCCIDNYVTNNYTANASYRYDKSINSVPPGIYSYQVPNGIIISGQTYYYKAAAQNNNNDWSPWATGLLCNHAPTLVNLQTTQPNYCAVSSPSATLSWNMNDIGSGDIQSAYYVQISERSDFTSLLVDTGKVSSGSQSYSTASVSWGKTYYWRLKVWDSCDNVSNSDIWTTGASFSIQSHASPKPDFTWFPDNPTSNATVLFRDQSVAYGGYSIVDGSRVWSFQDSTMFRDSQLSPIVKFNSDGSKTVSLSVTDNSPEAFTCTSSKTITVGGAGANTSNLPCWREINPH